MSPDAAHVDLDSLVSELCAVRRKGAGISESPPLLRALETACELLNHLEDQEKLGDDLWGPRLLASAIANELARRIGL